MADKILLPDIPVNSRVGCCDEERQNPQRLLIDLELGLDLGPAAAADSIEAAVDYVGVRATVEAVAEEREYRLIETIADRIATRLQAEFSIDSVLVRIKKPSALAQFGVPYAAVETFRDA